MIRVFNFFNHKDKKTRDDRWIFGSMLVGALLSLLASFVLSVEAVQLAANPDVELACSINAVLNCASVGLHESAHMFGFPSTLR